MACAQEQRGQGVMPLSFAMEISHIQGFLSHLTLSRTKIRILTSLLNGEVSQLSVNREH